MVGVQLHVTRLIRKLEAPLLFRTSHFEALLRQQARGCAGCLLHSSFCSEVGKRSRGATCHSVCETAHCALCLVCDKGSAFRLHPHSSTDCDVTSEGETEGIKF